jgi:cytoskeleton protein RodZ
LESLPLTTAPNFKTDALGINTPFHAPGDRFGSSFLNQFSRPLLLAVLVFLVGAIVLLYFPFTRSTEVANAPESKIAAVTPVRQELTPVASENLPVPGAAAPTPSSSLALASSDVALTGKTATAAPATAVPGSVAGALAAKASDATAAGAILVVKTQASSWIEVIDGAGVVQARKIMTGGEVLAVSGARPLSVVIGRSNVTEVQVRGKPLDLTQLSKNGVARFEVK